MSGEKFGGKHSSFARLAPLIPGRKTDDEINSARHTDSDSGSPNGPLPSRVSRPKPVRPPPSNGHQKADRASDEEYRDNSPSARQDHKSAWTRLPKGLDNSSPPKENPRSADGRRDQYMREKARKRSPAHHEESRIPQRLQANELQHEFIDRNSGTKILNQIEALNALTSQKISSEEQNAQFIDRPQHPRGLGRGRLQDREEMLSQKRRYKDNESDRTQSSIEATHSGSPKHGRRTAAHEIGDPKVFEGGPQAKRQSEYRRSSREYLSEEIQRSPPRNAEKPGPNANGSLSILPDAEAEAAPSAEPHQNPYFPAQRSNNDGNTQQVYKLLEEVLRGQGQALPSHLPPEGLVPGMPSGLQNPIPPYTSLPPRLSSGMDAFRGNLSSYPHSGELDNYAKLASRRWAAMNPFGQESAPLQSSSSNLSQMMPNLPPNLTNAESQALLQALQQKYQANEMEAVANITIQAILQGSANRDAANGIMPRKRKLGDFYEQAVAQKRHSSLMSESELFHNGFHAMPQQICAECGTTNTPTWRRHGKRLMCNACGLRRSRSLRSARTNPLQNPHGNDNSPDLQNYPPHLAPLPHPHRSDEASHMRMSSIPEGMRLADMEAKPEMYQH